MANCCRPELVNDVISYQKMDGVQLVYVLISGDSSSNRKGAIRTAHFVTTTTATTEYAYYPINA
jgi:hypothetical protein